MWETESARAAVQWPWGWAFCLAGLSQQSLWKEPGPGDPRVPTHQLLTASPASPQAFSRGLGPPQGTLIAAAHRELCEHCGPGPQVAATVEGTQLPPAQCLGSQLPTGHHAEGRACFWSAEWQQRCSQAPVQEQSFVVTSV